MNSFENGFYVLGLVKGPLPTNLLNLPAIEGAVLQVVSSPAGLVALGCSVSLSEFGPETLPQHLQDSQWLTRQATRHYVLGQQVFQATQPFLPFRLCTVFSNPQQVARMLSERQPELEEELARLHGRAEYGLKIWGRTDWFHQTLIAQTPALQELQAQASEPGGKAFFARKKLETALTEEGKKQSGPLAQRLTHLITGALALPAENCRSLRPGATIPDYVSLANLALLLDQAQGEQLNRLAERLDREILQGGLVEVQGPLPAYTFIRLGRETTEEQAA